MPLTLVTNREPARDLIDAQAGRMTYMDWCIAEVERMRAAGANAALDCERRNCCDMCCVVRSDPPARIKAVRSD